MKTSRLILLNALIFLLIMAAGVGGYYYYFQQSHYVITDDAKVKGDIMPVHATASGKLSKWDEQEGETVQKGDVLGVVTGAKGKKVEIQAPMDGTLLQNQVHEGQTITPGQPLVNLVDMDQLYIEANIEETDLKDVKEGASVEVTVDAQSDTTFDGEVEQIGLATASTFSLMPEQNASGDYTKTVQRIPVKIKIDSDAPELIPGLNATVRISK